MKAKKLEVKQKMKSLHYKKERKKRQNEAMGVVEEDPRKNWEEIKGGLAMAILKRSD